jgi:hypothetical protein
MGALGLRWSERASRRRAAGWIRSLFLQWAAGSGHRECRVSILAARGNTRANIHGRRRQDGCEDESRQAGYLARHRPRRFFLPLPWCPCAQWMGKHVAALALPCPALPWQTLALPCSCTALARDTDTPLRYASLAIRQCQLWRAGCLPSELDHFARACVSPRPGMDSTAISRACPLPNVATRQVSQMYRQAAADSSAAAACCTAATGGPPFVGGSGTSRGLDC